jgi:hypothetical protein
MTTSTEPEETEAQRVERDYDELLEEIRIALPGAEVMLGFLLTVPFTDRFSALSEGQRTIYLGALLCVAASTALLLAPTAWHRIRFKKGDKPWITRRGTALVLAAMVVMVPGITGTLFVVTDVILSRPIALAVGVVTALLLLGLWFAVPLARHRD